MDLINLNWAILQIRGKLRTFTHLSPSIPLSFHPALKISVSSCRIPVHSDKASFLIKMFLTNLSDLFLFLYFWICYVYISFLPSFSFPTFIFFFQWHFLFLLFERPFGLRTDSEVTWNYTFLPLPLQRFSFSLLSDPRSKDWNSF